MASDPSDPSDPTATTGPSGLTDPEDLKLVTLARATRARTRAAQGAAVRDQDGRAYAGSTVALPSLQVSAVQLAVGMALSSGARGLEAVVILGDSTEVADADLAATRDLGGEDVPVHLVGPDGSWVASTTS